MGAESRIEWCHHSFNPWWGCAKVSSACKHCYAEAWAKRTGHNIWGEKAPRRFFGDKHWAEPLKWDRDAGRRSVRKRVFCASMADVFEDRDELNPHRSRLWSLIESTQNLDWMLLTKRPENAVHMMPRHWPISKAWIGVTVDDRGPERLDVLRTIPAQTRFASVEPLVERFSIAPWLDYLNLVIVGAESGPGAAPMDEGWVRLLRDECTAAGVAFFYKQKLDERGRKVGLPVLDGQQWAEMPNV